MKMAKQSNRKFKNFNRAMSKNKFAADVSGVISDIKHYTKHGIELQYVEECKAWLTTWNVKYYLNKFSITVPDFA